MNRCWREEKEKTRTSKKYAGFVFGKINRRYMGRGVSTRWKELEDSSKSDPILAILGEK